MTRRREARLRVLSQSVPVRVAGGVFTVVAAMAFVPLGLVLPTVRWVAVTALAWAAATAGIVGLIRRRPVALVTPILLILAWFSVQ